MILYLVSKGADVTKVNIAKGRRPPTWPTVPCSASSRSRRPIKLLEKLGAKNNNKCVSC